MDDDLIDITHMTEEDRREHYRRINQLTTCPCVNCSAICDRWDRIASCGPYQEWREFNMQLRGYKKPVKR